MNPVEELVSLFWYLTDSANLAGMNLTPTEIRNRKILLACLDWGMGHTTRCVSILRQLLSQSNEVQIACNEKQRAFFEMEFPDLKYHQLKGYDIKLDSEKSTFWQIVKQFGNIKKAMKYEGIFLQSLVDREKLEVVISDNRYGFYNPNVQNILITHQLNLQLPRFGKMVNRYLKKWIEKFDAVWVPDQSDHKLTGSLSKHKLQIPVYYIGYLCRFKKWIGEKKFDYLAIISGPEPERTRFALMVRDFLEKQNKTSAVVGFEYNGGSIFCAKDVSTEMLEQILGVSDVVISRAGYTTIMEMTVLEKKAILVPTPGQYEQEYLASHVKEKNITFMPQAEFSNLKVKFR